MVYKYGMKLRGVGIGCQPSNFLKFEDVNKSETGFWSYIYYDHCLSDKEINKYDLKFISAT